MSKNAILKGTLILTIAGLLTRIIGFFYKIFLSKALGAELLGVYQLIFPVYGICFTLYASGIQTAISKIVAEEIGRNHPKGAKKVLKSGLFLSVSIALFLSILLYMNSKFVASKILLEPSCDSSLRILAIVFPFCGITSCINGYYYGLKRAFVPATTQLLEQIIRVVIVYFISIRLGHGSIKATCELAVLGLVVGEIASSFYNIVSLAFSKPEKYKDGNPTLYSLSFQKRRKEYFRQLGVIGFPLTSNRLLLSILHSFEAIIIPTMLKRSGLSNAEALSLYGILHGMTIPFLLFPSTLTNSLSVLLLPAISEANAKENKKVIASTVSLSIKYSLMLGIFSTGIFMFFGKALGSAVFNEPRAGTYLVILSWLCPFLYIATTLSSILNGLGKTHLTFINSIVGTSARILLMIFIIPHTGIYGYLISLLISQLLITALDVLAVCRNVDFSLDAINSILKPALITVCASSFFYHVYQFVRTTSKIHDVVLILINCLFAVIVYLALLVILKAMKLGEWKS